MPLDKYQFYSFHKKGNKIRLKPMISIFNKIKIINNPHQPLTTTVFMVFSANLLNINKIGATIGKPKIAINEAFCWAFAAIADKKVNTIERLVPPKAANAVNNKLFAKGEPKSR